LVSLFGIFLVFALGTSGIKWYAIPIVALCVPNMISHSGLPEYLREDLMIDIDALDIAILKSDITLATTLIIVMALVAGFVVLHQMISLRQMGDHLSWRGVDESDIVNAYRGRSIAVIAVVTLSVAASYLVSHYSSTMKDIFSEQLNLSPLLYLVIGIAGGLVTIAVILMLLGTRKAESEDAAETRPKGLGRKVASEAVSVVNLIVPSSVTGLIGRGLAYVFRPVVRAGRSAVTRVKESDRFNFLKRE
ncbi:hypothetical protein ACFLXN_03185, partial [Chloroflexota bacterium]